MNCQDISRLVDTGKFSALSEAQRRDADAHALSCRHCAPLWIMHERVAATPVPAMPAELSVRCLTLAAAGPPASTSRQASRRVMIVVGCVVALAAVASMIMVNVSNAPAPQREEGPGSSTAAPVMPPPQDAVAPAVESAAPSAAVERPAARMQRSVPLFPPPLAAEQAFAARRKLALEKLVELYPELLQAQPTGIMFAAAIALRADGTVFNHVMRTATPEAWQQVDEELEWRLPKDGGGAFVDFEPKGAKLADGRILGADLRFRHLMVRNAFDPARSSLRVDEIMRAQRANLMLPATDAGGSHVTVLLSRDGAIQREVAGFIGRDGLQQQDSWSAAERAQDMARRLGVSADEIGLMGSLPVFDNATRRVMLVDYAWQRLPGESGSEYHPSVGGSQSDSSEFQEGVDLATALALVERVMPDAFMGVDVERALGMPAILLTEEGEFIRTGRIKLGTDPEKPVRDAFPGVSISSLRTLVLKNGKGATSAVMFIWQASPATRERLEKSRNAGFGR